MIRKVAVGLAVIAMTAVSAPAFAITDTHNVTVNIQVAPNISFWPDHANVNLVLDGDPENKDAFQSGFSVINNVNAKVDAQVNGTLPTPAGAVNFFLFYEVDQATALSRIVANSNNPLGALKWTSANLGATQELTAGVGVNQNIVHKIITYAADAPNILPLPNTFALTVTYTLTSLP